MHEILPLDTYIAGKNTVADWLEVRGRLIDFQDVALWSSVYENYFMTRLQDRYITPIEIIKSNGSYRGEGFAIMTIICSIIEFLETTYQGLTYRFIKRNDPPLSNFEYSKSETVFNHFLTERIPFKQSFTNNLAQDFYKNVRCGLLHEARTKGTWTIWGNNNSNQLVETRATTVIVFRDNFYNALIEYVKDHYKLELLDSQERKEAFLRKFDSFCYE
jgi:hypothetical protein